MKVLITGGAGYIGSVLTPYLLKKGYSVTVLDNLYYQQDSLIGICHHNCFEFQQGDARDEKLLQDIIPKFDIIIPLACLVGAPACDKNRKLAISSNYKSIKSLIKYSSLEQKIIFPTTNSGYGIGIDEEYCTEKSPLNPISFKSQLFNPIKDFFILSVVVSIISPAPFSWTKGIRHCLDIITGIPRAITSLSAIESPSS